MKYIGSSTRGLAAKVDVSKLTSDELQFRAARHELLLKLNDLGHYGCMVFEDSYKGNGLFTRHLYPIVSESLAYEERGEIRLDALYDKTKLYPADLPHITDREVGIICNDKARTSEVAGDLQPKSILLRNAEDLSLLANLDNGSGLVVVKSLTGYGGRDVYIDTIVHLQENANLPDFPLISQEFIETSQGIPGLCPGRHDVRALVLNGEVLGGSIRTPQEGSYLSNTHQGGTMRLLDVGELPEQLITFATEVDSRLPNKPRLYAADFMYSLPLDKWFLVELNGSPGALPSSLGDVGLIFQQKLTDSLIKLAFKSV